MSLVLLLGAGLTGMKNAEIDCVVAFLVVILSLARYASAVVALYMLRNLKVYAGYLLNLSSLKKQRRT
jgi:hypothetical protein